MKVTPTAISRPPSQGIGLKPAACRPNRPSASIASEVRMLAVRVRPLNGPAPTLSMKASPPNTATAPARPPRGAYHGILPRLSRLGSGVGMVRNKVVNTKTIGRNDTDAASHGLTSLPRSCAFIALPRACSAPAIRMKG